MCRSVMMVGFAIATMVESTMIMKNPIIIAQSACHGFPLLSAPEDARNLRSVARSARLGPMRRVPPDAPDVVMHSPRFSARQPAYRREQERYRPHAANPPAATGKRPASPPTCVQGAL